MKLNSRHLRPRVKGLFLFSTTTLYPISIILLYKANKMEELFEKYLQKIQFSPFDFVRGIMNEINWNARFPKPGRSLWDVD